MEYSWQELKFINNSMFIFIIRDYVQICMEYCKFTDKFGVLKRK